MVPGSKGLPSRAASAGRNSLSSVSVVSCRSMCINTLPRSGATSAISAADSGTGLPAKKLRFGSSASAFQRWMRS